MKPCSSVCSMCRYAANRYCQCAVSQAKRRYKTSGRDICWSHQSSLEDWTTQLNSQLIFSNFENDTKIKPYAIFYDEANEEVVIAILGTLSLEDCITDALASPVSLTIDAIESLEGDSNSSRWAHEGMLKSAKRIKQDIDDRRILKDLHMLTSFDESSLLNLRTSRVSCSNFCT